MHRFRPVPYYVFAVFIALLPSLALAQKKAPGTAPATPPSEDISGMYSFLKEGEFVQITVEDGRLSGFISRYGDSESDQGAFLNQFFDKTSLNGRNMSFTTKPVHGKWYEFKGTVQRGAVASKDKDGYWVLKGTLKENSEDENKKVSSRSGEVEFKSFPANVEQ